MFKIQLFETYLLSVKKEKYIAYTKTFTATITKYYNHCHVYNFYYMKARTCLVFVVSVLLT